MDVGVAGTTGAAGKPLNTYDLTRINQASNGEMATAKPIDSAV
jgi:hypothetical protein